MVLLWLNVLPPISLYKYGETFLVVEESGFYKYRAKEHLE